MERSDEARREDSLQQSLGKSERRNRKLEAEMVDIEEKIQSDRAVDLLAENKQQAEKIAELKSKVEGLQVNRDYLFKENERFRAESLRHTRLMDTTREQLKALEKEVSELRSNNSKALEQIWNKLKLVKLFNC